ncbi:mandelate racemase/muconate lactonizing enzyme family protein [Phytohabitans sp. ZYX-F-186]|uniref:Mandelate racemase/muconate lactonizing enzyme family protein n=1 Tax=Phytohabitans maris TaxID=3071409 RepID=A0ABU0ZWM5_9ACTN|nr:mandelate racemase/muconate lactonizing enzyme family protein [Phytohabitans sp. ZYX-F-186]MDQ7911211.1 mandelate racemase/muconate lactonizing enzyme family protein [Phytohabitans sp. ZYX-F-186]
MKVLAIETLRQDIQPNVVFVRVHTDDGLVGLGESFYDADAVEAYLHASLAPALFAVDDLTPEAAAASLAPYVGFQGGGVDTRARGAVDLALWDLLGHRAGLPVARLLGGPVRQQIGIYNTCAGSGYVSASSLQQSSNWGLDVRGHYDDLNAFLTRPAELARELYGEGIPAMKVWPFDQAAERAGGADISRDDLARGVAVIAAIRDAVPEMDIMVELHGLFSRRAATKICDAVTPYGVYWVEDPIRPDAVDALAGLRSDVDVPIAVGETCVGRRGFLPLLERHAIDVVTCDVQWTGGLTEARKIASLADAFSVAIAPHDCTGPVTFAACCHLSMSQPNALIQETVRAFLRTWYADLVVGVPEVAGGMVSVGDAPGLGVTLRPEAEALMRVRRSTPADV